MVEEKTVHVYKIQSGYCNEKDQKEIEINKNEKIILSVFAIFNDWIISSKNMYPNCIEEEMRCAERTRF